MMSAPQIDNVLTALFKRMRGEEKWIVEFMPERCLTRRCSRRRTRRAAAELIRYVEY